MIKLTDSAKKYIDNQLSEHGRRYVKLSVKGGGCAGFSYDYSFCDDKDALDFEVSINEGHGFLIDGMSFMYVAGTELDYVSDIAGSSLKISNPNETSSCGCGKSFAV